MSDGTVNLQALRDKLISSRSLYFAIKETQVLVAERAFDNGKLTSGADVQYNEDYEVYAYTPPSPRAVSGRGKPYSQWKNPPKNAKGSAAKIKGGYYPTYLAYKAAMGRDALELTGRLRKAYLSDASLVERSPIEVDIVLRGEEAAKYRGLTDNKGAFLQLSSAEREFFIQRLKALT